MPHWGVLADDCQDSSNRSLLSSGLWPFVASVNNPEMPSSDPSSALLRYMLGSGGSGAAGLFDGGWELGSPDPVLSLHKFLPSNCEGVGEEELFSSSLPCDLYSTDEFRMFEFKVRRCVRWRSHDWTECPFAHPGEKARRRDPRAPPHYSGTACPDFRKGSCKRGDGCEFAHGVFECWLHPQRYRTHLCKDGKACRRRVCFFAHTPDQLRAPASDEAVDAAPDESSSSSSSIHGPRHATFVAMSSLPDWPTSSIAPPPYHRKPLIPLTLTDAATSPPRADMTPASIHGPRHGGILASSPPKSPNSPFDWPNSPSGQIDVAFARGPCSSTIIALSSPKSPNSPLDWPDTPPSHCGKHLNGNVDMGPSLLGSSTCRTASLPQSLPNHDSNGHLWHNMEDLACSNPIITFQPSPTEAPKMRYFSGPSLLRTGPASLWSPSSEEGLDLPLQRVESGRGIRAEIFENLLKKNQQNSTEGGLHLGWVDDLVKDT